MIPCKGTLVQLLRVLGTLSAQKLLKLVHAKAKLLATACQASSGLWGLGVQRFRVLGLRSMVQGRHRNKYEQYPRSIGEYTPQPYPIALLNLLTGSLQSVHFRRNVIRRAQYESVNNNVNQYSDPCKTLCLLQLNGLIDRCTCYYHEIWTTWAYSCLFQPLSHSVSASPSGFLVIVVVQSIHAIIYSLKALFQPIRPPYEVSLLYYEVIGVLARV